MYKESNVRQPKGSVAGPKGKVLSWHASWRSGDANVGLLEGEYANGVPRLFVVNSLILYSAEN